MRRLTLFLQLSLVVVFAAFTGWTVGVVKLVEVLMTAEGGRFATASEQRAETFLVSFGVSKALCNGLAGWLADARGRRAAMLVGWAAALALAPAVLFAQSWSLVVAADCLLGANQAFCWSTAIFVALDLLGPRRRALAVGLVETVGYSAVALAGVAVAAAGRGEAGVATSLVPLAAIALVGFVLSAAAQRETRGLALHEAGLAARPAAGGGAAAADHGGAGRPAAVPPPPPTRAFALGVGACCLAGLALNFTTAFAWGALTRWLAAHDGGEGGGAAAALLAYSLPKGLLQLPAGRLADRRLCCGAGSKGFVVAGLAASAAALAALAALAAADDDDAAAAGGRRPPLAPPRQAAVVALAAALGCGCALAYSTLLAVAAALAPPARRSSVVGAVRCVRDLGYAVGGLLLGGAVDAAGGAGWTAPTLGAAVCALAAAAFALAAPNARADGDAARLLAPAARAEGACELQGERASSERAV